MRLDMLLTKRYPAYTRTKAQIVIKNGLVRCDGKIVIKPGAMVTPETELIILENEVRRYVSRGGLKLEKAIEYFKLDFQDARVLDIGSSTGGFCDCALQYGAAYVCAVDVGTDIMDRTLRKNSKIELHEKTDIRDFNLSAVGRLDYIIADVSFISLDRIIPCVVRNDEAARYIFLIKPQFECGKKIAHKYKGVIRDPQVHIAVIQKIVACMSNHGKTLQGLSYSPITGGNGNIEYVSLFGPGPGALPVSQVQNAVSEAFVALGKPASHQKESI